MTDIAEPPPDPAAANMIGRFHDTLLKTRFLSPDRLLKYQRGLLERLLRHARMHVPFYRDSLRLDPLFRRDDTVDWERWNELPLLTRADLQAAEHWLKTEYLPPEHGHTWPLSTSGSTGQPITVTHTRWDGNYASTAQMLRILEQHAIDPTQRLVRISNFPPESMGPDGMRRRSAWFPGFVTIGLHGERIELLNMRPVTELVEAVLAARPRYLWLQPVLLELMCGADQAGRLREIGIEKVLTTGEQLTESAAAAAATHLRCKVVDIYSSQECGTMASVCPQCGRYHVEAECHFVEVVGVDGAGVAPGDTGSIVVTPLYNYAMPLIRYEHADRARLGAPGGCSFTLPALDTLLGKEFVPYVFRGGVALRPIVPVKAVIELLGSASFRVVQVDDERCEILLKPHRLRPDEMRFDELTELLRKLWWSELKIDYRIVDQLSSPAPGKIKLYDRLTPAAPAPLPETSADTPGGPPEDVVDRPDAVEEYRRFYSHLRASQSFGRAALDRQRDGLLRRLVEFAYRQSPFYRERLQPLFRGSGEADLSAWRDIPLLRRADLQNEIDRINPQDVPRDFGQVTTLRTSGSSGPRLSFRTCMLARLAAECMMHRLYEWHGLDTARPMASIRWYGSGRRQYPDGVTEERWSFAGEPGPHHTLDLRHPVPDLVEWLLRRGPSYLLTFPSVAYDIAQFCADGHCGAVTKIVGISEIVTPEIRAVVRDRLGCDIAQIYACSEMGCIALQSPLDDSYFTCEETVLVEILSDTGEPVRPGETGRMVLTSFYNYATPFIRYEIGDWATLAAEPCPSGRALLRIARIDGRARNALRGRDGRRIWPHQLAASELNRLLAARSFQVRQSADRKIEIRFVPIEGGKPDAASVAAALAGLLGYAADVALVAVDAIARTSGGKRELIVSEIE